MLVDLFVFSIQLCSLFFFHLDVVFLFSRRCRHPIFFFVLFVFFFKQKTAYAIRLSLVGSEMCIRDRFTAKYSRL